MKFYVLVLLVNDKQAMGGVSGLVAYWQAASM
jgi:hypothetical protein